MDAKTSGSNVLEILLFRGLTTPLALLLVVLQGRFLAPDGRGTFVLAVLTVSIFSRLLSQLGVAVANRMGNTEWDEPHELRSLVQRALGIALALGLVVGLGGQVHAALLAWTAAHVLTAALALYLTRDLWRPLAIPSLVDEPSQTLVRLALAMGALQVIALIGYRAELFVLEALKGVDAVGIYSIANQAAESLWLIAAAIATAITAPVVRMSEQEAVALVRRSLTKALLYTAAAGAVIVATAPFVIRFALGDAFKGATKPLLLLLPGAVAYAPVQILVVYLSVRRGRPRLSLAAGIVATAATVAASFPLISAYGPSGAAAASAIGYACGALVAWALFRRLADPARLLP